MELNLLLLPLLGGYFVYLRFHGTAYYARQCSSQRLLFNSAIVGLLLLLLARGTAYSLDKLNESGDLAAQWLGSGLQAMVMVSVLSAAVFGVTLIKDRSEWRNGEFVFKVLLGLSIVSVLVGVCVELTRLSGGEALFALRSIGLAFVLSLLVLILAHLLRVHTLAPFPSLLFRIAMVLVAAILAFVCALGYQSWWEAKWNEFSPYPQSGTALTAFSIGFLATWLLNRLVFPHEVAIHRLYMGRKMNTFDRLMYESMLEPSQVQITLKDGKVYVGWVLSIPPQLDRTDTHIELLPVSSGYREPDTKEYVPKTFYENVYEHYRNQPDSADGERIDLDDFKKVLPLSEILIVGKFKADAYLRFLTREPLPIAPTSEFQGTNQSTPDSGPIES